MLTLLALAARHGRWLLVAGLLAGVSLPSLAGLMRPWLPEMVAGLIFLAALRVGPKQAVGAWTDLTASIGFVGLFQVAIPLIFATVLLVLGWRGALATAIIIAVAAPPISGSPSLTIMLGHDPAVSLRQLVVGTALLPLTVIPVFALVPEFGNPAAIFQTAFRLLLVIAGATAVAFAVRSTILGSPTERELAAMDGFMAIFLAIIVIGLMAAVGPAITEAPTSLAITLLVVFALNFGTQYVTAGLLWNTRWRRYAVPLSIGAGNRNVALFLAALPVSVTDPLLLFIGCYQIPMYLTPILMGPFYAWLGRRTER